MGVMPPQRGLIHPEMYTPQCYNSNLKPEKKGRQHSLGRPLFGKASWCYLESEGDAPNPWLTSILDSSTSRKRLEDNTPSRPLISGGGVFRLHRHQFC